MMKATGPKKAPRLGSQAIQQLQHTQVRFNTLVYVHILHKSAELKYWTMQTLLFLLYFQWNLLLQHVQAHTVSLYQFVSANVLWGKHFAEVCKMVQTFNRGCNLTLRAEENLRLTMVLAPRCHSCLYWLLPWPRRWWGAPHRWLNKICEVIEGQTEAERIWKYKSVAFTNPVCHIWIPTFDSTVKIRLKYSFRHTRQR